jgi:hypothetical protein
MPSKYTLLEDYLSKHRHREDIWREQQSIRVYIEGHKQVLKHTGFLLVQEEERLRRCDASYVRVSAELRDLEDLLCKEEKSDS